MWQDYLSPKTDSILVGIYLEAQDFEYFRKIRKERNILILKRKNNVQYIEMKVSWKSGKHQEYNEENILFLSQTERATYIANAVLFYREKYSAPTFLIRCDNYVWCLKRFKTELQQILFEITKKQKLRDLNIHFPDKGKVWRYVEDFALISGCNHTVILR